MANEWTTVTKRSHRRLVSKKAPRNDHGMDFSNCSTFADDGGNYERTKAKIDFAVDELRATQFCKDFLQHIHDIVEQKGVLSSASSTKNEQGFMVHQIVCYGLGRIATSYISRFQLALLLILREHLSKLNICLANQRQVTCYAYDPVFTELDTSLLQSCNIEVLSHNEEGRRKVESSPNSNELTTFYMVHCDKFLYNNLLGVNQSSLHKMIVIGNSFNSMKERVVERTLEDEYKFIYRVLSQQIVKEVPLSNWQEMDDIFNDTSIHHFEPNF